MGELLDISPEFSQPLFLHLDQICTELIAHLDIQQQQLKADSE
jgi:hypothetical protein